MSNAYSRSHRQTSALTNRRIHDRNIPREGYRNTHRHTSDVDRLLMERDSMFAGMDSNMNENKRDNMGEITGSIYDNENIGRGLPLRSQYTIKKPIYDANEHLDFELFDDRPSKLNVKYNDQSAENTFADLNSSMTQLSSQINPLVINSMQIDKINNNAFYYLFDLLQKKSYIVNGFGLYNLFGSLYLSSSGITEIELKKFFTFPKKDILYTGLSKINNIFNMTNSHIKMKNFLIVGSDVPYDPHYYDKIRDFCILIRPNTTKPDKESQKMTSLINRIMEVEIKNPITPENLDNLQLMFMSVSVIHPKWEYKFAKISRGVFNSETQSFRHDFLHSVGAPFGYFEDDYHQLLEVMCSEKNLVMGFLLHKSGMIADIDDIKLHFFIDHIKRSILDEVLIPVFTQDLKLRFNSSLKNMGLNSVFMKVLSPEFFPEGVVLQDVVQNIKITVDNFSAENNAENKGYRTSRTFIADRPFIYYFRLVKTNTILMMGSYA